MLITTINEKRGYTFENDPDGLQRGKGKMK